ncbi:MAG TPA: GNAT family N-acetyltransferase [Actinomycetota bacterium]|nr:GNAT family N-acetyltransferase [Actinomycetota bacterium]
MAEQRDAGPQRGTGAAPSFEVRPSRPADVRSFLDLYRAVVREGRYIRTEAVRRGTRYYRKTLANGWRADEASIVAVAEGRVIGHLGISREEHPTNRHVASLGMMVASPWRGRGVGSALMAEAIRWARDVGVEKVALSVYPDNEAGRALYRKFGFVEEGRLSGHSKKRIGYRDEIVLGLWLIDRPHSEA